MPLQATFLAPVSLLRPKSVLKRPRCPRRPPTARYEPPKDDRPESLPETPTELTLAQQLLLKQYEEQVNRMSTEECKHLAIEIARQMMVKDNVLRKMFKKDINVGVDPPNPADFEGKEEE